MIRRLDGDVVVIGGGVIGLACAYELVACGRSVVVLERDRAGSGAGAVAAGMLAPVSEVETEEPAFVDLALESCGLYAQWVRRIEADAGLGCGYREEGSLLLALHRDHEVELERLMATQRRMGLQSELVTRDQALDKEPYISPRVTSGLFVPGDRQVNPRRLTQALAAAIRARGGTIIEGEAAQPVYEGGIATGATTSEVEVHANAVVIAAGAWSGEIWPARSGLPLPPVSTGGAAQPPPGEPMPAAYRESAPQLSSLGSDSDQPASSSGPVPVQSQSSHGYGSASPRSGFGPGSEQPSSQTGVSPAAIPDAGPLPMRPVKGQILRLRGPQLINHVLRTPDVYLVPREDGELVVGGTMEEQGFDTTVTTWAVMDLLRDAWRILPGISELELAETAAGLRPALRDHLPAIGPTSVPGLFVATGHYRHGVLLAPATARLLAGALDGDAVPPAFDPKRLLASSTPAGAA